MFTFENTLSFAQTLDEKDELKNFRSKFYFPFINGRDAIYFTGNSLGLQPRTTQDYILRELEDWASYAVEGHLHGRNPWLPYHEQFAKPLSTLCGALEKEVVAMNQLTVNLHLLMVSFYRPNKNRYKIICEARAFPSDQYALESQVKFHGYHPDDAIIEVHPRAGENFTRSEDVISAIEKNKDSLALVMLSGVHYLSGSVFDIEAITKATHAANAIAGFDLAHTMGNIELELHEWNVDFACWCSYKYLNSGPGSVAGAFVHEKHLEDKTLPRFAGWWGHDKERRFLMEKGFNPIPTAEAWQLSNAPILSMAAHKASLDVFMEAGFDKLLRKSKQLTSYLEFIISQANAAVEDQNISFEIITPRNRGCQLSVVAHGLGKELYNHLIHSGIIADWREPNVIRFAPVPLYNSYEDVWHLGEALSKIKK